MSAYGGVEITNNPAIFSGRPIINEHRITVHDVVVQVQTGMSSGVVAREYGLTADEIAASLAYYEEHKATIDRQIAADNREFGQRAAAERVRET